MTTNCSTSFCRLVQISVSVRMHTYESTFFWTVYLIVKYSAKDTICAWCIYIYFFFLIWPVLHKIVVWRSWELLRIYQCSSTWERDVLNIAFRLSTWPPYQIRASATFGDVKALSTQPCLQEGRRSRHHSMVQRGCRRRHALGVQAHTGVCTCQGRAEHISLLHCTQQKVRGKVWIGATKGGRRGRVGVSSHVCNNKQSTWTSGRVSGGHLCAHMHLMLN
jgi:hypothetical protein